MGLTRDELLNMIESKIKTIAETHDIEPLVVCVMLDDNFMDLYKRFKEQQKKS